jgi:hypothetical protein
MLSCGRPALLFLAYVFFKPNGLQLASCWAWMVPEMPIGSHFAPNELSRRTPPHLTHLLRAPHILAASQTILSDGCRSFPFICRHKTAIFASIPTVDCVRGMETVQERKRFHQLVEICKEAVLDDDPDDDPDNEDGDELDDLLKMAYGFGQ